MGLTLSSPTMHAVAMNHTHAYIPHSVKWHGPSSTVDMHWPMGPPTHKRLPARALKHRTAPHRDPYYRTIGCKLRLKIGVAA